MSTSSSSGDNTDSKSNSHDAPSTAPSSSGVTNAHTPAPHSSAGRVCKRVRSFLIAQHLPLGLAFFTLFGFLVPVPGKALAQTPLNTISIVGIFFIAGLNLQTSEVKAALRAVPSYVFGFLSILAISPCLAFPIAHFNLGPAEFARGMALFAAMPTTTTSGVVMTTEAGGNVALSVLLAVGTNLVGVATSPFFVAAALESSDGGGGGGGGGGADAQRVEIDPIELLWKLALSILLPLLAGKALRRFKRVENFTKSNKLRLKLFSSFLLIAVPWMSISAASDLLAATNGGLVAALAALGIALHALLLVFNYFCCMLMNRGPSGLHIGLAERKAVVVNASQKTLNTAVAVIALLPSSVGDKGLITVPCIIAHFAQIIMDAFIVAYWKKFKDDDNDRAPSGTASEVDNGRALGVAASLSGDVEEAGGKGSSIHYSIPSGGLEQEGVETGLRGADSLQTG
jgi:sodium/bile acid cotransporter 7